MVGTSSAGPEGVGGPPAGAEVVGGLSGWVGSGWEALRQGRMWCGALQQGRQWSECSLAGLEEVERSSGRAGSGCGALAGPEGVEGPPVVLEVVDRALQHCRKWSEFSPAGPKEVERPFGRAESGQGPTGRAGSGRRPSGRRKWSGGHFGIAESGWGLSSRAGSIRGAPRQGRMWSGALR